MFMKWLSEETTNELDQQETIEEVAHASNSNDL